MRKRALTTALLSGLALIGAILGVGCAGALGTSAEGSSASKTMIDGPVAAPRNAIIEAERSQLGVDSIKVSRVVAPARCWLVAQSQGTGRAIAGSVLVQRGESLDVEIPLGRLDSPAVTLRLLVDRGRSGTLDYDRTALRQVADRPVYVNRAELALPVDVRAPGVIPGQVGAYVTAGDQPAKNRVLVDVIAPGPSWVAVYLDDAGRPGRLVGLKQVPDGQFTHLAIPLKTADPTPVLYVGLHADRGVSGEFEFDTAKRFDSPDQFYDNGGAVIRSLRTDGSVSGAAADMVDRDSGMGM